MSKENRKGSVHIDAEAEREFDPDIFVLNVDFYGECDDRASCVDAYNEDLANVIDVLVSVGIQRDTIKNSEFRADKHVEWLYEKIDDGRGYYRRVEPIVKGYEYRGDCTVTHTVDGDLLKRVIHSLQELEGGFSFDVSFDLERPDRCEEELLKEAVDTARSRAEVLVRAAGAKLGPVETIHHRFDNASTVLDSAAKYAPSGAGDCEWLMPLSAPDFNPEAIGVRCSVSISWAIE